jgi:hypothetical protein
MHVRGHLTFAFSQFIGIFSKKYHSDDVLRIKPTQSEAWRKQHQIMFTRNAMPSPRPRCGAVPDQSQPIYINNPGEGRVARYRLRVRTRTLTGRTGQCPGVVPKQECAKRRQHVFNHPSDDDSPFNRTLPLSDNRAKLDKRILQTAAKFIIATNFSCRQVASPVMDQFMLGLLQIGANIQANDGTLFIDAPGFLDTITKKRMAEAIRQREHTKFVEGMIQLHRIRFASLVQGAQISP